MVRSTLRPDAILPAPKATRTTLREDESWDSRVLDRAGAGRTNVGASKAGLHGALDSERRPLLHSG